MDRYLQIADRFRLDSRAIRAESHGGGHINDTFLVKTEKGEKYYILQRINTAVFKNAEALMENIILVTDFLREKIVRDGGDPQRETMNVVLTKDGKTLYQDEEGCWRVYMFIDGTMTMQTCENAEQFYLSACAFGHFQKLLADFPADKLCESIPNFHNTKSRYLDFEAAVEKDVCGRAASVAEEIAFVRAHKEFAATLVDMQESGELPLRVTHNDTKLNNVLMDKTTGEGICIIDLDTVMPGLSINDFGDSIRFGANHSAEDETDLSKVNLDVDLFEAYTQAFLEGAGGTLTEKEIEYLPWGAKLMTLECGMRFLTDYLEGDVYFHISRERQNLDRCRTQCKLVQDMEARWDELAAIAAKYR